MRDHFADLTPAAEMPPDDRFPPLEAYELDVAPHIGSAKAIIPRPPRKSRFRNAAEFHGRPVPPRRWLVPDLVPQRVVTSLYGDGGTGKSLLALQLAIAVATAGKWLGRTVTSGPVVFLSAEDDEDELHRRFSDVLEAEGLSFTDLDRLTFRSLAGEDALLAMADGGRAGILAPSDLHDELDTVLTEQRPALLVLDTLADLFPGNENDRAQVTQFVGILIGLAIRHDCAVLLLAHPSRSGMASGGGDGGSTAWNGKVRSRLYLERVVTEGTELDTNARVMTNKKANLGPTGIEISMRWKDGVFIADEAETGLDRMAKGMKAERVFLKLLRLLTEQGRRVNAAGNQGYAPTVFAGHPDAEGVSKMGFRAAMEALMGKGTIRLAEDGPPSKRRSFLEVVA